ncbi:19353_t:CDS:2 [Funneliformis geosporum]|nr:19353_t:CDS:2 [Funneliformis geosporum]
MKGKKKDTDKEGTIWGSVEEKRSLKFFLKKCDLDTKADMPYDKICITLPGAFVKLSQINDYRGVTFIAHVSLFNSHYRANRMKIRNLLDAYAFKRDMIFSSRVCENIEKGKYPSASVRHNNKFEKKGLVPVVLEDLSNKKLKFKARLAPLGKKKQHLGKIISLAKKRGKRVPESLNSEYSSVCFDYDYWDSKQKALKLYINTFYGKAGNSKSPIFLCELAGGTTSAGKYNLNLVVEFVTKKRFRIKYGDTNSLYLICSNKYYEKCDEAFFRKDLFKEVYWTEMVNITMIVMKSLRNQVNAYLEIKNGTSYLSI